MPSVSLPTLPYPFAACARSFIAPPPPVPIVRTSHATCSGTMAPDATGTGARVQCSENIGYVSRLGLEAALLFETVVTRLLAWNVGGSRAGDAERGGHFLQNGLRFLPLLRSRAADQHDNICGPLWLQRRDERATRHLCLAWAERGEGEVECSHLPLTG
mmetsp:Transcript_6449/g.20136  ORF Transcript_6449/g.20136 Transcript_6449/m.20136 type:complete len:159 (-) Transcript_6449:483-959(-)|eukprot:scaffold114962_cov30-Tisochrysis_lutea.AAC.2